MWPRVLQSPLLRSGVVGGGRLLTTVTPAAVFAAAVFIPRLTQCRFKNQRRAKNYVPSVKSNTKMSAVMEAKAQHFRAEWLRQAKEESARAGIRSEDDVYFLDSVETRTFSLEECVQMHREFAVPEMLNNVSGEVWVDFELSNTTKKKTKFSMPISTLAKVPHAIDFVPRHQVIAVSGDSDAVAAAEEAGAVFSGGPDLLKQLESGEIHYQAYDYLVVDADLVGTLPKLRVPLRDKMPSVKNGRVVSAATLPSTVELFRCGVRLDATRRPGIPEASAVSAPVGRLDWPADQLTENLAAVVAAVWAASARASLTAGGGLVRHASVRCPPSDEAFRLTREQLTPPPVPKEPRVRGPTTEGSADDGDADTIQGEEVEQIAVGEVMHAG